MEWLTTLFRAFAKPFQWWVVVGPWEQGLRIRLGKTAANLAPGIHFRIPFLDRVHVQSVRLRTIWTMGQTFTTRDSHPITVAIAVDFAITDLPKMFNSLAAPDKTLIYRASAAIGAFISTIDRQSLSIAAIERDATDALISFGCGLGQIRVRLTTFAYARAHRIIMNEYHETSGLHNAFDREPACNT